MNATTQSRGQFESTGLASRLGPWLTQGQRFEFVYDPDEVDDGQDNNGNGLIDEGRIVWTRNVGAPDERSVVLCHQVREYLEGEVPNGLDDNGNGLVDEKGLSFERNGETAPRG